MFIWRGLCLAALCAALGWGAVAGAEEGGPSDRELVLMDRIDRLEQRIEQLEKALANTQATVEATTEKVEATREEAAAAPEPQPGDLRVYWKNGLRMETQDKDFQVRVGGRIMADFAWFDHPDAFKYAPSTDFDLGIGDEQDGIEFRRARIFLRGTIFDNIYYKAQYDFADDDPAQFKDVYLGVQGLPYAGKVQVGHFKEPFSLEEVTSSNFITFMERALPNVFAPARNFGAMNTNTWLNGRLYYGIGVFKDVDDWPSDDDSDEDQGWAVTARIAGQPWFEEDGRRLLHLGAGYSHRNPDGTLRYRQRPESHLAFRYLDTRNPFLGGVFRDIRADSVDLWNLESALVYGPFSLQGEYMRSDVDATYSDDLAFDGWYAYASYFLTGEHRGYKQSSAVFDRVKVRKPFSLDAADRGWGAWELALRYSTLDLNDGWVFGGDEDNITLALNWYLNDHTRVMLNYINAAVDRDIYDDTVDVFQTRFQIDF